MNANGRRCRQARNGYKHLARICGKAVKGGRPIYSGARTLTVQEAIARERRLAAQEQARKGKKKK